MKLSLAFVGFSLFIVCYAAAVVEANTYQDARTVQSNFRQRRNYRRARQPSQTQILGEKVPSGPPVKISNAHSGVVPVASRKAYVEARSQRGRGRASTFKKRNNPAPSTVGVQRRRRRRRPFARRQQVAAQRQQAPVGKQLARRRFSRKSTANKVVKKAVVEKEEEKTNHRFARKIVEGMLQNVKGGARLIGARGNYGQVPLVDRLIDNATLIRENLVDGFDCTGMNYGYYADQMNDCQVFHVCVNMQQIFPGLYTAKDTYHFSFICPEGTIFSQDAMVCAWEQNAVPCGEAHNLFYMNENFFVVSNDDADVKKYTTPKPVSTAVGVTGGGYTSSRAPVNKAPLPDSVPVGGDNAPLPNSIGYEDEKAPLPDSVVIGGQTAPLSKAPLPNSIGYEEESAPIPDSFVIGAENAPLPDSVPIAGDSTEPISTPVEIDYGKPAISTAPTKTLSTVGGVTYPTPAPAVTSSKPPSTTTPNVSPPQTGLAGGDFAVGGGSYPTQGGGVPGPIQGNSLIQEQTSEASPGPLEDSVQI